MAYAIRSRNQHLSNDGTPKRILALDGGGLRGIFSPGLLQEVERILRERHGGAEEFRLCHYFDLIAGTSTGAIIAATLASGWSVDQIRQKYLSLGKRVFKKSLLRKGLFRAKYDEDQLVAELKEVYGEATPLGSADLQTGLLVMTKRLDTGSPWPISNNPNGKYFSGSPERGVIGNADYPLWQVVRASTAAPSYFKPETIVIAEAAGKQPVAGEFVDGGVSPFNNPAFQALLYATAEGHRIGWPTGEDRLLLVSVGTGAADPNVSRSTIAAKHSINALLSLMEDSAALQETLLQWLSNSPTARVIDRELGDLSADTPAGNPLLTYLRYNTELSTESVRRLDETLSDECIASLSAMDDPDNMDVLHRFGARLATREVKTEHFPPGFDIPPS